MCSECYSQRSCLTVIFLAFKHFYLFSFFFFNDTATTEIYTLSLHDALPICGQPRCPPPRRRHLLGRDAGLAGDRKSTRLNSSHANISYAVFCLKKHKYYEHLARQSHRLGNPCDGKRKRG